MTPLEEIHKILVSSELTGNLVFGTTIGDGNEAVISTNPQKKVVKAYTKAYASSVLHRVHKSIIDYVANDADLDEVLQINKSEIPQIEKILKKPEKEIIEDTDLKNTKFTAFHLRNSDLQELVILREYSKSPFLSKKRLDRLIFSRNVLGFSDKDSIRVERKIDCIIYNDKIYIFRKKGFEKIFDFKKVYEEQAKNIFYYFENHAPYKIKNLKSLKAECKGLLVLRRASNIFGEGTYRSITIDQVKKFSEKNPDVGITVDLSRNEVEFPSLKEMFFFFDEDYYNYETTGNKYTALLKKKRRSS